MSAASRCSMEGSMVRMTDRASLYVARLMGETYRLRIMPNIFKSLRRVRYPWRTFPAMRPLHGLDVSTKPSAKTHGHSWKSCRHPARSGRHKATQKASPETAHKRLDADAMHHDGQRNHDQRQLHQLQRQGFG